MYGIGYNTLGDYKKSEKGIHKTVYTCWKGMFERCYSEKCHKKQPSYIGCLVSEEWHDFQNFAKWFYDKYVEGWCLDKDIINKGNKVYSTENCCFVPNEVNVVLTNSKSKRGNLPIGVSTRGDKYKSQIKKDGKVFSLGYYKTPEEAFKVYKIEKEKYLKEVAEKWKNKIEDRVYKALNNYKIDITD